MKALDPSVARQLEDLLTQPSPPSTVVFSPSDIVRELEAYGENEAASKIPELTASQMREVGLLANKHYTTFDGARGPMLDTAVCLAIVEYLEGSPRPLRCKRRVYPRKVR